MTDGAITVLRTNVAGVGYVNAAGRPLPHSVIESLELRMPYWNAASSGPSVREAHGELIAGYCYISVGIYWPAITDEYGRSGLFCWVSRVYPMESVSHSAMQNDMETTLAVIRESSDWLRLPLQIVARTGGGLEDIEADLTARISERQAVVATAPAPPIQTTIDEQNGSNDARVRVSLSTVLAIVAIACVLAVVVLRTSRRREASISSPTPAPARFRSEPRVSKPLPPPSHDVTHNDAPPRISPVAMIVTADSLNVRAQPDIAAAVIGGLAQEERVLVFDERPGWKQIRLQNGEFGWISADHVELAPQ